MLSSIIHPIYSAGGGGITVKLDEVTVDYAGLMQTVSDIPGMDREVSIVIIFDDSVPLNKTTNVGMIFNSVGYIRVRFFELTKKTGKMREVFFGRPVQFTTNPE